MAISGANSNISKSSNAVDLYQGESKDLDLEILQEVKDVNGVPMEEPVDLTGATLYFSVRTKANSPDLLIDKQSSNILNIEILSPATAGRAVIHLVPADTRSLSPNDYVFDIWAVLSSGKRVPVVEISEFIVKEPVTKIP